MTGEIKCPYCKNILIIPGNFCCPKCYLELTQRKIWQKITKQIEGKISECTDKKPSHWTESIYIRND